MKEIQEKVANLEMKFSFQEDLLQSLNETIVKQQKEIVHLAVELASLQERLHDVMLNKEDGIEFDVREEKPPHY